MTNKILDHIEAVLLDRRRPEPLNSMSFKYNAVLDDHSFSSPIKDQITHRAELRVYFEQWVTRGEGHDQQTERAKMAIARHLYADVLDALYEAREECWEDGRDPPKAMTKLMDELTGQFSRFE